MNINNANKTDLNFIKGRLRELKLDIQQIYFAISDSEKTKNPVKSLFGERRAFLEIINGLKNNVEYIVNEIKINIPEEDWWRIGIER